MSQFIPWVGGKTYLADTIIKMFPVHKAYVEVFLGGGSVFFAKQLSKVEIINDINSELVTLYKVVKNHKDEFLRQFETLLVSRDQFESFKMTPPQILTDIQRAARFFYLQRIAFGGKVVGQAFGTSTGSARFNMLNLDETLFDVHYRLAKVTIENLPYNEILARYDGKDTLFYLDPPYYGSEKYYGKDCFSKDDYARLEDILNGLTGKFLLSINDCPEIRETFKSFDFVPAEVRYTIGPTNDVIAPELIYKNF